jgi:hypothetical protein
VAVDARGVVVLDDGVVGVDGVMDEAVASVVLGDTPRSRSPILGRSFIPSSQYCKGTAKCVSKHEKEAGKADDIPQETHPESVSAFDSSHDYGLQVYAYLVPYSLQIL